MLSVTVLLIIVNFLFLFKFGYDTLKVFSEKFEISHIVDIYKAYHDHCSFNPMLSNRKPPAPLFVNRDCMKEYNEYMISFYKKTISDYYGIDLYDMTFSEETNDNVESNKE